MERLFEPGEAMGPSSRRSTRSRRTPRLVGGFTYVALLFALVIVGLLLASTADSFVFAERRNIESHQKWVANQYIEALRRYRAASPSGAAAYPKDLSDLLLDSRFPTVRRHLREIYADPATGAADWLIVMSGEGQIVGVESRTPTRRQFLVSSTENREAAPPIP